MPLSDLLLAMSTADAGDDVAQTIRRGSRRPYSLRSIALVFGVPALGGFLFGFDISVTSYAVVELETLLHNSPTLIGVTVSAASLGAFLGSLFIFTIADFIGRRAELRYGAMLYMAGACLEVGAGVLSTTLKIQWFSISVLILGRLIYGVGIACVMHGGPTYIAEMAPSTIRGLLVSLKEAMIVLGILFGYCIGFAFSHVENGWVYAYGSSLVVSTIMLMLSFAIPPSSRWLLLQGREEEALESVRFVFVNDQLAMLEWEGMKQAPVQEESPGEEEPTINPEEPISLWNQRYRAPMIAGIGLVVLQQITGQPSVLSYATPIFQRAGLSAWSSILVAVFKLCATLASASSVETYGRKKLLYTGNALMLGALLTLTVSFGNNGDVSSTQIETVILLAMFVYIGGYQFSFGPISWLMISECFPMAVRGQAVAVAVQMNFLFNAMVQFAVPVLERVIGLNVTFGIFALLTACSIVFVKIYVPETKGLTLEEIEQQFESLRRGPTTDDANTSVAEMERLVDA